MIKNIFIDLDGTLLNDQGLISQDDIKSIKSKKDKANIFLITGMPLKMAKKYYDELELSTWLISSNGSTIMKEEKFLTDLTVDLTENDLDILGEFVIVTDETCYSNSKKTFLLDLINGLNKVEDFKSLKKIKAIYSTNNFNLDNTKKNKWDLGIENIYYYSNKLINKYQAIKKVIDNEDYIYIGNGRNDIESLQNSIRPIVMKNSHPYLLEQGFKISEYTNNESGVSHILNKLI